MFYRNKVHGISAGSPGRKRNMRRKRIIILLSVILGIILIYSFTQAGAKVGAFRIPVIRFIESLEQPFIQTTEEDTYLITVKNVSFLQSLWIRLFWKGEVIADGDKSFHGVNSPKICRIRGGNDEFRVIVEYHDGKIQIGEADARTREKAAKP